VAEEVSDSETMRLRDAIAQFDLPHRRGWRLSERTLKDTLRDLQREVNELWEASSERGLAEQREEVGDCFVMVLQTAAKLGMGFAELDAEGVRKLRLRFEGVAAIEGGAT
jgi:NTP pyrophosphatase (non-canonical NTP hydrolase)